MANLRMKDLPTFVRVTDLANDTSINYIMDDMARLLKRPTSPAAIIMNTFGELEPDVLRGLSSIPFLPPVLPVGPLSLLLHLQGPCADGHALSSLTSSLWKEDAACLRWLDGRKPGSVVYVNYGSVVVMTSNQLVEFAWGIANSGCDFLWVIRPDLVSDGGALPAELMGAIEGRGFLAGWCPQEAVLRHPAVGGFLTHGGWNSVAESICCGVPMLCWPSFSEQTTNCRYMREEWGIGLEIEGVIKREAVAALVRELMGGGEAADARRRKVREWKEKAAEAAKPGGTSFENLKRVFGQVMLPRPEAAA